MLRQLHADVCAEKAIPPGSEAADLMALKIMTMFTAGVTDVHALRSEVMKSKAA
jgi:hypothetical protein